MIVTNFEEDLVGLTDFSERLLRFIEVEHHFVDGSLVIGLSSKYGTGKSTFFRMWKDYLERNPSPDRPVTVIRLDAWEGDYFGDPLFSIVYALLGQLNESGKEAKKVHSAILDVGWFATILGGQLVEKFSGLDFAAAGKAAEEKKAARESGLEEPPSAFAVYEGRRKAMDKLKSALQEFIEKSESRLLFLVDELDRCRPDFAISYLETIKHIFDLRAATFILAADRKHLENSAKTAFGANLDFDEYYRKFVHREISLPAISKEAYQKFTNAYAKNYLERDNIRQCFMGLDENRSKNIADLISALHLTPRQTQECFRVLGHMLSTVPAQRGKLYWCLGVASMVMAAFRIAKPEVFQSLGNQSLTPKEVFQLLNDELKLEDVEWWFTLLATGQGIKLKPGQTPIDALIEVGLIPQDAPPNQAQFRQWTTGWGQIADNRFAETYRIIEHVMQW